VRWIYLLTEPVLAPVRRVLPFSQGGGFDFSPIVVFIIIDIIKQAVYGHF
jgi:YggT family protein